MKKVKKVRKSSENIERSESQFYFALAFTQFISENVRLCRIAGDKTGKDPRRVWRM